MHSRENFLQPLHNTGTGNSRLLSHFSIFSSLTKHKVKHTFSQRLVVGIRVASLRHLGDLELGTVSGQKNVEMKHKGTNNGYKMNSEKYRFDSVQEISLGFVSCLSWAQMYDKWFLRPRKLIRFFEGFYL